MQRLRPESRRTLSPWKYILYVVIYLLFQFYEIYEILQFMYFFLAIIIN